MLQLKSKLQYLLQLAFATVILFSSTVLSQSDDVVIEGYLIDNYCWELTPEHVGFDGTNLEFSPERHWLHCLTLSRCQPKGFAFLAPVEGSDPVRYVRSYHVHEDSKSMVYDFFVAQEQIGDRRFDDFVTVTGTLSDPPAGDATALGTVLLNSIQLTTASPTINPSQSPTPPTLPTIAPSNSPTLSNPTSFPSTGPTVSPTPIPTKEPTIMPSSVPTTTTTSPTAGGGTAGINTIVGTNGELGVGFPILVAILAVGGIVAIGLVLYPLGKASPVPAAVPTASGDNNVVTNEVQSPDKGRSAKV